MTWFMPCKDHSEAQNLSKNPIDNEIADELIDLGQNEEDLLKEYKIVDESEVNYDFEDEMDEIVEDLNETELARVGKATPYRESSQDGKSKQESQKGVTFLVRYVYSPARVKATSREFCKKMVAANKVYRKEDIMAMSKKAVNAGFGKSGAATYSIWLYKGGARCNHKWFRKTYAKKGGNGLGTEITSSEAKSKGFKAPKNAQKVPVAPKDMPYKGYTASYAKKIGISR